MHVFQRFYKHVLMLVGIIPLGYTLAAQASLCPEPALDQVIDHRIEAGETLSTVAAQYDLLPATLLTMNPTLPSQGPLPAGRVIEVLPFNGRVVQVGSGQTWQSLAERHGTRADLLFEVNGCPSVLPGRVFIPGSNPMVVDTASTSLVYPLSTSTRLI
ncbi:MAG: LysM domain-containing protein, partial [Cyanobacteria bacterium J06636_28]